MTVPIRFEEYRSPHAGSVADMWRDSREGWPPGFLGSSVFTAESVDAEERASGRLFTVLALQGERVVGFCRTTPWGGEPEAAYVGLLSVVPDLHGKKIGRDLLLDAVSRSAGMGYRRIDLNTWPANMKAMPLYKKTGFFWVPDTQVYMQNYMPYLMRRPEVMEFLDGDDWYGCLERCLSLEPDEERTASGREVFTYILRRNGQVLRAEFDRRGRILSGLHTPKIDISVELDPGPVYFGRPVGLAFSGGSLPPSGPLRHHPSVSAPEVYMVREGTARVDVTCLPVPVPVPERDRMPTVSVTLPGERGLEVGLGLRAEEPISLVSPCVMWISPEAGELTLDVRKLGDPREVRISAELDGELLHDGEHPLGAPIYQRIVIPVQGGPEKGLHLLSLRFLTDGSWSARNSLVLVCGESPTCSGWLMTRTSAVKVSGRLALVVRRLGLAALLVGPDRDGRTARRAWFRIQAGPPYWNSDLPHQLYDMSVEGDHLLAYTDWPSRPGIVHSCSFRLDGAGFAEAVSSAENRSGEAVGVSFSADWDGPDHIRGSRNLYPLVDGLFSEAMVHNQVPDIEEDLPKLTGELGAPWLGLSGEDGSLMVSFPGWRELRYDQPCTGEMALDPGETVSTPPARFLSVPGGTGDLLAAAEVLGWETGPKGPEIRFLEHDLLPVMARSSRLTLSHRLLGQRSGRISVDGATVAEGMVRSGENISGASSGSGIREVSLQVAGRDYVLPVLFHEGGDGAAVEVDGDDLLIIIGRLTARVAPGAFGHVYSVLLDGREYLLSEHPGPSAFEWESPWYGGIHPRLCDRREAPFRLDWQDPSVETVERLAGGLMERGWRLGWEIDHKRFGSWRLTWTVTALPDLPILRTTFRFEPMAGCCPGMQADIRGFLAPSGDRTGSVLTCDSGGPLRQGRDHAGSWAPAGIWARVCSPDGGFVEAFPSEEGTLWYEDYAGSGCHLSQLALADRGRYLQVDWLFGSTPADLELSSVLHAHAEARTRP